MGNTKPAEHCYCCGAPMLIGQPCVVLKDDDGLIFYVHTSCAERDMESADKGTSRG